MSSTQIGNLPSNNDLLKRIAEGIYLLSAYGLIPDATSRVSSLDNTSLVVAPIVEVVGVPAYVSDVSQYEAYNLTETGWYAFARILARTGTTVSQAVTVDGVAGYVVGADHIDLAVRFEVAAQSCPVTIHWGDFDETIVFRATDLAVRNLDYRVTFYVYDIAPYATWSYALTTDTTFQTGKQYYTLGEDEEYHLAEVTAGAAVPADTYYKHTGVTFEGMTTNITYKCDTVIDCPVTFVLPEVEDDIHGCWIEVRLRLDAQYSTTLVPPEGVKVATEHTQPEKAGINMIDLHYSDVAGAKLWRFLNTQSTIPA